MRISRNLTILAALMTFVVTTATALAAQPQRRGRLTRLVSVQPEMLPSPDAPPVLPRATMPLPSQKYIAPALPAKYCVKYKHHCTLRKKCCGCCVPQKIILDVQDPCCQPVAVPVSIPGCCQGDPYVSTGRDIMGRFSYTYKWRSGYKIDVVFRPRGDVVVHTWGR